MEKSFFQYLPKCFLGPCCKWIKNKVQIWRFLTKICNTDPDFNDICYATSNASFSMTIWS